MDIYLVGGFVRDTLLGLDSHDIDYVVVNGSPQAMRDQGFQQVGEFPVFLHPDTQDEYALARSETSTGDGYADFHYHWEGVSLEEDLSRRDLTINAMAMTQTGDVIDPFNGQDDLKAGILRHVSDAFIEDPLRVLRVARFAARFGFAIADETMELMKHIVAKGMIDELKPERVWKETEKALMTPRASRYFEVLKECGALAVLLPEIQVMDQIPQRPDYHAEGNVWIHTMMVLDSACELTADLADDRALRIRVAALLHDLGKTVTPKELLWAEDGSLIGRHHGHEDPERYRPLMETIGKRFKIPTKLLRFADTNAMIHQNMHSIRKSGKVGLLNVFERIDADRHCRNDPHYLEDLATVGASDNAGRLMTLSDGSLKRPESYPQGAYFQKAMEAILAVHPGPIMQEMMGKGMSVEEAKNWVTGARRKAANAFKKEQGVDLTSKQR